MVEKAKQTTETEPEKTDQTQTQPQTGKSELLDAGNILREIIGLKAGNRIADLGAGGGLFTTQAAMLVGGNGQVYAVDIIKNILSEIDSKARMSGLNNIKTIWSNVEVLGATKIPDNSLDAVFLVNILFQSDKHYDIMAEATRLLKSGGKMLIIDWSDTSPGFTPASERQVDQQKLIEHAQELDLGLVQEFKAGNYHFGLVFVKN